MEEKTTKLLADLSAKTGRPLSDLQKMFTDESAKFKASVPGQTEAFYEDAGRRRVYILVKAELKSPAKPYDLLILGASSWIDTTVGEMEEKNALYANEATRAKAIAEKQVYSFNPALEPKRMQIKVGDKVVDVPDGTPLDTRPYYVVPDAANNVKGIKNPNYLKPLQHSFLRTIVGFGRPSVGGALKLVSISASHDQALRDPPKVKQTVRVRLTLKDDRANMYVCNSVRNSSYEPIEMPELKGYDDAKICALLDSAPSIIHPTLSDLMEWQKNNEKDGRRLAVFTGDVSRVMREPTSAGSYLVVIEDTSALDLEAEGTPIWVPKELAAQLDFGNGSKVVGIARTNIGPGYNQETRSLDNNIERVQLNAVALFADPVYRTSPEEENVLEGEEVK